MDSKIVKEQKNYLDIQYPNAIVARMDCLGELHSSSLDFSLDGKFLAIGTEPDYSLPKLPAGFAALKFWHTDTYREETTLPEGYPEYARVVRFSPDGKLLAVAYALLVNLWDIERKQWFATPYWGECFDIISSLVFTSDAKYLMGVDAGYSLFVWEVSTRQSRRRLELRTDQLLSLIAINSEGNELASGSWGAHTIAFWDIDAIIAMFGEEEPFDDSRFGYFKGLQPTVVLNHGSSVWAVGYSPNGKLVVSGGNDGTVKLWDATTKQEVAVLNHGASLYSIDFSPDGALLVSSGGGPFTFGIFRHAKR